MPKPKTLQKYTLPTGTSFWPLRNRVDALTKSGNPTSTQNNTCFANVALHAICFVVQAGPLSFVIDDWGHIKDHSKWEGASGHFFKLFEKLLFIASEEAGPTIQEVHLGLHELSMFVKPLTYNKRVKVTIDMQETMVTKTVDVITKDPKHQQLEDAGEVFMWLAEALHFLAGINKIFISSY